MNYKHSEQSTNRTLSTDEVFALIRSRPISKEATGSDYFAERQTHVDHSTSDGMAGATALKNKDEVKNFKAVAPVAHPTTAQGSVFLSTSELNALAASADEPMLKPVAPSPCSSADDQNLNRIGGSGDDAGAANIDPSDASADFDGYYDPDFFKLRVDLFDNGEGNNRSRFTAKLSVIVHPESDPDKPCELFTNFYGRSRDFKAFLRKHELLDTDWYRALIETFEDLQSGKANFAIKPIVGPIKKRSRTEGQHAEVEVLENAGCILYQIAGRDPVILIFVSLWEQELELNEPFQQRVSSSKLFKRGSYVDPKRANMVSARSPGKLKKITASTFR